MIIYIPSRANGPGQVDCKTTLDKFFTHPHALNTHTTTYITYYNRRGKGVMWPEKKNLKEEAGGGAQSRSGDQTLCYICLYYMLLPLTTH